MATTKRKYIQWFAEIKNTLQHHQVRTALQVNRNMLIEYWYIGNQLSIKIEQEGWGATVIDQLSEDLQKAFPDVQGYSARNLLYMRQFAASYPNLLITQQPAAQLVNSKKSITQQAAAQLIKPSKKANAAIVQQPAAQFGKNTYTLSNADAVSIPWGHHMLLLDKVVDVRVRKWYIEQTLKNNWSRAVLKFQIETDLYNRQAKKITNNNFERTLPKPQSDLANQMLKDPFVFKFIQRGDFTTERELERILIGHIREFLIELGAGFSFAGSQVKLQIGKKERRIDLLFYHLFLRCYVVIELKLEDFEMEFVGQMNTYLNVVNKQLRHPTDNPSIGIILCSGKDNVEVDFALSNINHPIGVAEYSHSKTLPKAMKDKMPTAKQLQDEVKRFLKMHNRKNKE